MAILCSVTVAMLALTRGMFNSIFLVHLVLVMASDLECSGVRFGMRRTSAYVNPMFIGFTDVYVVVLIFIWFM